MIPACTNPKLTAAATKRMMINDLDRETANRTKKVSYTVGGSMEKWCNEMARYTCHRNSIMSSHTAMRRPDTVVEDW